MLVTPSAGEVLCDFVYAFLASMISKLGELHRVTFARNDGTNDEHSGLTGNVGHRTVDLHVHLVQSLLHPLDGLAPMLD